MKTQYLFSFGIICVLAVMLVSCGTSIDIAKRHFNDGYYVHISKKKQVQQLENRTEIISAERSVQQESASIIPSQEKENEATDNFLIASTDEKPAIITKEVAPVVGSTSTFHREEKINSVKAKKRHRLIHKIKVVEQSGNVPEIILIILCIFIPPLAIYLAEGVGTPFWVDLIMWLVGWGAFTAITYSGLLVLIAIIYAFVVCF